MASSSSTIKYKQTTRQTRLQTREGEFTGGIAYTNTPISEGYSKVLMNYDIESTDGSIKPRQGFQAQGVYQVTNSGLDPLFNMDTGFNTILDNTVKIADSIDENAFGAEAYKDKLIQFLQYNTKDKSANLVLLKEFNRSQLSGSTQIPNESETKQFASSNISFVSPVSNGVEDYYTINEKNIEEPNIHSQYCMHNLYFKKPIGCFAFNNTYYTFSNAILNLNTTQYVAKFTMNNTNTTITDSNSKSTEGQFLCFDEDVSQLCVCNYPAEGVDLEYVWVDPRTPNYEIIGDGVNIAVTNATNYLEDSLTLISGDISLNLEVKHLSVATSASQTVIGDFIIKTLPVEDFLKMIYTNLLTKTLQSISDITEYNETKFGQCAQITLNLGKVHSSSAEPHTYYVFYTPNGIKIYNSLTEVPETAYFPQLHYFKNFDENAMSSSELCAHKTSYFSNYNVLRDMRIVPQELNPTEAGSGGYNMLLENPYDFACEVGVFDILGVLPYDTNNIITLTPILNRNMILKCFYRAPTSNSSRRITWEWREVGATTWNEIKNEIVDFSLLNLEPLECPFSSAVEQCIIRVTISDPENTVENADGTTTEYVDAVRSLGMNFIVSADNSNKNADTKNYDLNTAKGMLEWKSRLVLWGVQSAENIIFTSDVNNPSYFPYPNNVDILDEPIIHCMIYGDDLIVFTATKLYRLVFDNTGITWNREVVQNNLHISEKDIPMFAMIKNMLFFKSGNYYYMLVPKSSSSIAGETTIAPVSNTIKYFLDNFTVESKKILNRTYRDIFEDRTTTNGTIKLEDYLANYYSYIDNESIILNFVYDYAGFMGDAGPTGMGAASSDEFGWVWDLSSNYSIPEYSMYLVFALVYNTTDYTWRFKTYMTPRILTPIYKNALMQTQYLYLTESKVWGTSSKSPMFVRVIKDSNTCVDNLIISGTNESLNDYENLSDVYVNLSPIKNYQYLDTGYRILTTSIDFKKRFREVQFSLNNISQKPLTFYTEFLLDGNLRKDSQGYNVRVVYDDNDNMTGTLIVERPYLAPIITPGNTTLDETFILDNTAFPELAYWKVRVQVSGKGYTPRLQLVCESEEPYSIFSMNWVYRTMNSR